MVLDFLRRIGAGIWGYVAVALAVLTALLLALAKAKKAGKDEVIAADRNEGGRQCEAGQQDRGRGFCCSP
jgi:hypothetical protein